MRTSCAARLLRQVTADPDERPDNRQQTVFLFVGDLSNEYAVAHLTSWPDTDEYQCPGPGSSNGGRAGAVTVLGTASSNSQNALQESQIRRVGETESVELALLEPVNGIVFFGLPVRNRSSPPMGNPHGEVQPGLRIDSSENGITFESLKLDPQLFGQFSSQSVLRLLAGLDVTTRKVPHVREPQTAWRSVT